MEIDSLKQCPVCGKELIIEKYVCPSCNIEIKGNFKACFCSRLSKEDRQFLDVFIRNAGNLKEIGKFLGVSYPTVKAKLKSLQEAWGVPLSQIELTGKASILDLLEMGEISASEAEEMIKNQ
ncbi:MAG: DUF2089 domain-containing protein [Candidatus Coatesbacteria bacterium]|nr:DUF2089 domain-containing protein [Candidatus Coatesbacteria bacterium]